MINPKNEEQPPQKKDPQQVPPQPDPVEKIVPREDPPQQEDEPDKLHLS